MKIRRKILTSGKIGIALRPGVFSPQEIREAAPVLDQSEAVSRIFIPDGRVGYESLEIVSSILSITRRIRAGSGVIRLLEHDAMLLTRRVQTIQTFSSNRFFLGVGTGTPGPKPRHAINAMLQRLDELKKGFQDFPRGVEPPEIYVAALKLGIAKCAMRKTNGLLMNFCSPRHASNLIEALKTQGTEEIEFACYLKLFYSSENDEKAKRLLLQEFLSYDSAPQYHEMFVQDGTAQAISSLKDMEEWKDGRVDLPRELLRVSLANPQSQELVQYVKSFLQAGVSLPVFYPYFPKDEDPAFKLETVKRILKSV